MIEFKNVSVEIPVTYQEKDLRKWIFSKAIGGQTHGNTVRVLDQISLIINDGERVGLVGANGAGKSTLLRTIVGCYKPSSGEVKVKGNVLPLLSLGSGSISEDTGLQNIKTILKILNPQFNRKKIDEELIYDIIEFSGIGSFINFPIKTYSSGMTARLFFSIVVHCNGDILAVDEVFGTGDLQFMDKAEKKISQMYENSNILVLATHNEKLMEKYCNKAIFLKNGRIIEMGDINKIFNLYQRDTFK